MSYGEDIQALGRLTEGLPFSDDPSLDALVYLSAAYAAIRRLEERGADLSLNGKPLVLPAIERAYREVMYVRPRLPVEWLDTRALSRHGRLV